MNFKYKAYNELLTELGQIDYVIELNELANRELKSQFEASANKEKLLEDLCKEHRIIVNYNSLKGIQEKMTLSYIAFVYHTLENFFYSFKDEYNKIEDDKILFESGKTKLNKLLEHFKHRFNSVDKIDEYLVDTFNYYHQLRVKFSHPKTTSEAEIKNKFSKAFRHRAKLRAEFKIIDSPKELNNIDFEDFFLFTKIAKEIARLLSSICIPTPRKLVDHLNLERFKKYNDEKRVKTAIQNELVQNYNININQSEDYIDEIYRVIYMNA